LLNNAVKRAVARDLVERNVVEFATTPRGTAGRKSKSLSEKQALDVLAMTKGHWMYPYIVVSMLVGIRTEEMRALTWDHVDLSATPPVIEVWRSVRRSGATKTKKSRRTLAIPDVAVEALRRRKREQETDRARAGADWVQTGYVFTTSVGTPLDAANVRRAFRSALKLVPSVDPKEWTPRELRHSFVSLMSAGGAAVEQIAHVVGHSDTSTTERIYRHELRPVIHTGATFMTSSPTWARSTPSGTWIPCSRCRATPHARATGGPWATKATDARPLAGDTGPVVLDGRAFACVDPFEAHRVRLKPSRSAQVQRDKPPVKPPAANRGLRSKAKGPPHRAFPLVRGPFGWSG